MKSEVYISPSRDAYFHLALEEYIARNLSFIDRKLLLIYINEPCVVLGKNQNYLREVNLKFSLDNNLKLARRISGGGTVVHDLGNINFAFFESMDYKKVNKYENSTGKLVEVINSFGVDCHLNERNAILLKNGRKISGSAQFTCSNAILSHFTLLYQSDLEKVNQILALNPYQIQTKASESVRSDVDNLSSYLSCTIEEFIQNTIELLNLESFDSQEINFEEVDQLMNSKYKSIEYIYDKSCHGLITTDKLEIEMKEGKIDTISGLESDEKYLGKRLNYKEIKSEDDFWNYFKL